MIDEIGRRISCRTKDPHICALAIALLLRNQIFELAIEPWLEFASLLREVDLLGRFPDFKDVRFDLVTSPRRQSRKDVRKMPHRCTPLVERWRKFDRVPQHQLAHVLPGHARDLSGIGRS